MNDAATNIVEEIGSRWKLYPVYNSMIKFFVLDVLPS